MFSTNLISLRQCFMHSLIKLTGNYYEAQDLFQDTAVRVITNADKFKQGTNFKAWSSTIMRNIFINKLSEKENS